MTQLLHLAIDWTPQTQVLLVAAFACLIALIVPLVMETRRDNEEQQRRRAERAAKNKVIS